MSPTLQKMLVALTLAAAAAAVAVLVEWRLEVADRRTLVKNDAFVFLSDGTRIRVERQDPPGPERGLTAAPRGPTVVFLSGLSGTIESWRFVQRDVARFAPTLAYDRAGAGFSDTAAGDRDARAIAEELDQVLKAANAPPPYILAAHSIAGLYARVYAHAHPDTVVGVVLVDPLTEDEWSRVSPASSGADQSYMFRYVRRRAILGYTGLLRVRAWAIGGAAVDPRLASAALRGDHWRTAAREADAVFASFDEARAAPFPAGAAVGILSAGMPQTADIAIVQGLHKELAQSAQKGRFHAVDPDADHAELLDLPEHSLRVSAFIQSVLQSAVATRTVETETAH